MPQLPVPVAGAAGRIVSVAIVIPLFNHERYIGEALRSVLAQTRPPERVLVIDDGSTDGSVEAARAVADPRITIATQANAGAHAALNWGIAMAAEAEFVGILNSDDVYEPDRIASCMGALERHPGAAVAATRLRLIDEASALVPGDDPRARWLASVWQARTASLAEWLGIANLVKTTSNVFARTAYLRARPFRPYRYVHDYYLAATAAVEDALVVLDKELLRYRVHGSNTIKSGPGGELQREVLRMNLDLLRALAPMLAEEPEARARFAAYFRTLSQNCADFRLEPFLHLLAQRVGGLSESEIEAVSGALSAEAFPELTAGKSSGLRERLAQAACERALQALAGSRWMALGRLTGAGPRLPVEGPTAEARLAALRKACAASPWYRAGLRLGLVYPI